MNYTGTIVIVPYCRAHDDKGVELANANACDSVSGASAKKEKKKTNRDGVELHIHSCKEKYTRDGNLSP